MNLKQYALLSSIGLVVGGIPLVAAPASSFYSFDGTTYSENFNSLPASLTTEAGQYVATDITGYTGWQVTNAGSSSSAIAWRGLSAGTGTASGYYGLGNTGDYALGGLSNGGSAKPAFGITLLNTSGAQINSLSISFDVEQWRVGTTNSANVLAFEYKLSNTYASIAGAVDNISFLSPGTSANVSSFVSSTIASSLDGNAAANRTSVTLGLTSLAWNAGEYLVLRWELQSGSLDAMGIDNVTISGIPEPATYAMLFGMITFLGVTLRRRPRRS
ncbi:MAG: PEP-CTERM sorting domain-containing protein [Opitutaceae bacterium]|jgi:hypothetical protein